MTDLTAAARRAFERCVREGAAPHALLEAAGRLEMLEPGGAAALLDDPRREALRGALGAPLERGAFDDRALDHDALGAPSLEDVATRLLDALEEPDEDDDALDEPFHDDPPSEPRHAELIEEALAARDRVELALLGAGALLGEAFRPGETLAADLAAFEDLLRPALWRLTALNATRAGALRWVPRRARARFWWRFEGVDVHPEALAALPRAAQLVAAFPEARAELEALVRAEARMVRRGRTASAAPAASAAAPPPVPAPVVSLADWVRRRRAPATPADAATDDRLAIAAAHDEELPLLAHEGFEVSFRAPDELVVDLLADRAPDEVPALTWSDGRVAPLAEVPLAVERFSLRLDARDLEGAATLRVPLASGTVEVPLPPEEE